MDDYTPGPLPPAACATCGEAPYYTKAHIDAAVAAAVAQERERCARVCDEINARHVEQYGDYVGETYAAECAAAIRATPKEPK